MQPAPINDTIVHRASCLEKMAQQDEWDLLIIGGGATGLGIALDAVLRGYKTLLLEGADFAKGTSSRSTKLVHGGVRYLAQGNVTLVREASVERGLLCRNAPHLVKDQTFVVPVYSLGQSLKYTAGLKLYDWIAGRLGLGSSHFISRKKTAMLLPSVKPEGLHGGVLYHDGQFDDSRLAVNLMQTIIERGGCAVNYVPVTSLIKNSRGTITGAVGMDVESCTSYSIKAKAIVNATGVFVDDILEMDEPYRSKTICVSQGVHLVVDKKFYTSEAALMIPQTSDGRVLFAVPWHGKVVIGTTDTPVEKPNLEPVALEKEVQFILSTAGAYLVQPPQRKDVLSVFAGLRPLAVPQKGTQKTGEISRSHKIIVSPSGLFTILGGKWTTYRKMGEDMVNKIEKNLVWPQTKSSTASTPVHGYTRDVDWNDPFFFYGSDAVALKEKIGACTQGWISEKLGIHKMQVIWAVENEMARTVEDVLARRTRALFLEATESIRMAPEVARIMAEVLHKDEAWINNQIQKYTEVASRYQLKP